MKDFIRKREWGYKNLRWSEHSLGKCLNSEIKKVKIVKWVNDK